MHLNQQFFGVIKKTNCKEFNMIYYEFRN